jgi:hypothetical protein
VTVTMSCAPLTLPALTSEDLEVPLLRWALGVDPLTLDWRAAVSDVHDRWPGPAPAVANPDWVPTTAVQRGTASAPDIRVLVPVLTLPVGLYGLWVRVAGAAHESPARWAGQLRLV